MQSSQKGRHWLVLVLLLLVIGGVVWSAFYTVNENEQAVIQTFGRYTKTVDAGLHWKLPWPVQTVTVLPVRRTQKMELGYYQDKGGTYHSEEDDSLMITGDMNLVNIDFFLEWKISDPVKFLFRSADPEAVLRNMLMSSVRSIVGTKTIDDALTTGKVEIQNQVQDLLMEKLEENDIGIQIIDVKVNDSEPPTAEVAKAFRDVETAKQQRDTLINQAKEYENKKLPEAKAEADRTVREAEGYKQAREQEAKGLRERYLAMFEQYKRYPEVTRERLYLEALQKVAPQLKLILEGQGGVNTYLPLNPGDTLNPVVQQSQAGGANSPNNPSNGPSDGAPGQKGGQ